MNKRNYQNELDVVIAEAGDSVPSLLLHSCCAPCSSYVLEYLSAFFRITVFYCNPNIFPAAEYEKRVVEQQRLIDAMVFRHPVLFVAATYEPERFYEAVNGLEELPEGGERCFVCYELRLRAAARLAAEMGFDYFTTTLSISPMKRADKINEIGERLGTELGVLHLPSDFKKRDGYKRSVELSEIHGLYRQNYCGCVYSRRGQELSGKR